MRDDDEDDTVIRRSRARADELAAPEVRADAVVRTDADVLTDAAVRTDAESRSGAVRHADAEIGDTVIRPAPPQPGAVDSADDTVIRPAPVRPAADPQDDTLVRPAGQPPAQGEPGGGAGPRLPADPAPLPKRVPSIRVGGRVLRLDRPVVIGRRPAPPRVTFGATPELVTVPSRSGQVSSSHVMVHAEGEAAVVDDLRSTNGTVVRPPGAAPFRMPAGASNVVLTGTVVEIGDGNVIEVLSPHLRVAPPSDDFPPLPAWPSDPPAGTPRPPRERS